MEHCMIYFTADWHLDHEAILKHCPARRAKWPTIAEMNAGVVEACNEVVGRQDELIILGDWAWMASRLGSHRAKIRAKRIGVVLGNHDAPSCRNHVGWTSDLLYTKRNGIQFHLSHYPIASWRNREHNAIHLYGHCHGRMEARLDAMFPGRYAMDVGIDNAYRLLGAYRPFSLCEVVGLLNWVPFTPPTPEGLSTDPP